MISTPIESVKYSVDFPFEHLQTELLSCRQHMFVANTDSLAKLEFIVIRITL